MRSGSGLAPKVAQCRTGYLDCADTEMRQIAPCRRAISVKSSYNTAMSLNLYRLHRRDYKRGHAEDSTSDKFDERKKRHKRRDCSIFSSGTLAGKFRRNTLNQ
jgi:hypothetical protein